MPPVGRELVVPASLERSFLDLCDVHPGLAPLDRAARLALFHQGTLRELAADDARLLTEPGLVFLVRGDVSLERDGDRLDGRAPQWLDVDDGHLLVAATDATLLELPPVHAPLRRFRAHPLLARLGDTDLAALQQAAQPIRLEPGAPLFAAGDRADAFYLLDAGAIEVVLGGEVLARLEPGAGFGERGLDPSGPRVRTAGARAVGPASLLRVAADDFRRIAGPTLFGAAAGAERPRDELTAILGAAWADVPPAAIEPHHFSAGAVILREDDPADAAWYLVDGLARVEKAGVVIAQVRPGETFGERGVLLQVPRTASVIAETDVLANRLEAGAFARWCAEQPGLGDLFAGLAQLHTTADGARSVAVYRGTHDGRPCLTAVAALPGGRLFTATKVVDRPILRLACDDGRGPATDHAEHARAGASLRLEHRDEQPVALLLDGDLSAAAAAGERLRSGRRLGRGELERFRRTGELDDPAGGRRRLVCGCVGVTRDDLDRERANGCRDRLAFTARTGAGGVCGGCLPRLDRLFAGPAAALPAALAGRVLDTLGTASPLPPDSVTWRLHGEAVALLGAARALLLQLALPIVAQSLVDHPAPAAALQSLYGLAFGAGATGLRLARDVRARAGTDPIAPTLWIAMTLLDTSVLTHEALVEPLTPADRDRLVAEAADLFGPFGIPAARFPADWAALRRHVDDTLASGQLVVGDDARALAHELLAAPRRENEAVFRVMRRLTARWLPAPLRAAYELDDTQLARDAAGLEATIRAAVPELPRELRLTPARLDAERRLAGDPGGDPGPARLGRVIAAIFGV